MSYLDFGLPYRNSNADREFEKTHEAEIQAQKEVFLRQVEAVKDRLLERFLLFSGSGHLPKMSGDQAEKFEKEFTEFCNQHELWKEARNPSEDLREKRENSQRVMARFLVNRLQYRGSYRVICTLAKQVRDGYMRLEDFETLVQQMVLVITERTQRLTGDILAGKDLSSERPVPRELLN